MKVRRLPPPVIPNAERMEREELRARLVSFGVRAVKLYPALQNTKPGEHIAMQLLRAATSVGANYAEAMHARTGAEFVSKTTIALCEAAESSHWIELIVQSGLIKESRMSDLQREAHEIASILAATIATYKNNHS